MSLAVVVIASEKRKDLLSIILDSIFPQQPEELVVVGDFAATAVGNWRYFKVEPITRTTIDALVKRDVGWAATESDAVLFLSDDHRVPPDFLAVYRDRYEDCEWDMLCPSRYTKRGDVAIPLNMGRDQGYIGGHAGIYRRRCAQLLPWSAGPHHLNWDVLHTRALVAKGASLQYADPDLAVEDIEPGATPWI